MAFYSLQSLERRISLFFDAFSGLFISGFPSLLDIFWRIPGCRLQWICSLLSRLARSGGLGSRPTVFQTGMQQNGPSLWSLACLLLVTSSPLPSLSIFISFSYRIELSYALCLPSTLPLFYPRTCRLSCPIFICLSY